MHIRYLASFVATALVSLGLIDCTPEPRCHPAADGSIVACVGDDAVTKSEAQEFLREPEWEPGSAQLPDANKIAVDKAIRRTLLAQEAKRRNLPVPNGVPRKAAALAQALLTDEASKRSISRDAVSDQDARRFYDERPEAFGQIDEVRVQAIIVASPTKAEQIYREAQSANEDQFSALVAKYSEDTPSKEKRGELPEIRASRGTDRELLKLALTLRRAGKIGGPIKANDGRYYVMRVIAAEVGRIPPFDEQSMAKAKNIIVFEKKEALAAELAVDLRKKAAIRSFDDAIAALQPASPAPSSSASH
jgi:hypothetical protein